MTKLSEFLATLPTAAVVALTVLLVLQIALQVFCLIDLSRRSRVPGGQKSLWVVLIIFGNLLGAILYLTIGRSAGEIIADQGGGDSAAREKALDRLYGDRDRR